MEPVGENPIPTQEWRRIVDMVAALGVEILRHDRETQRILVQVPLL